MAYTVQEKTFEEDKMMEQTLPKLKTNLDTNLLKLVAVVSMLLDHFGGTFFEQVPAFRWAGRLAFPMF